MAHVPNRGQSLKPVVMTEPSVCQVKVLEPATATSQLAVPLWETPSTVILSKLDSVTIWAPCMPVDVTVAVPTNLKVQASLFP